MENQINKEEKQQKALELFNKLQSLGYTSLSLTFNCNGYVEINLHFVTNLVKLKKETSVIKFNKIIGTSASWAQGKTKDDISVCAFAKDGLFSGCHRIEEQVLVPAQEEHYETRSRIECGKSKEPGVEDIED